MNNKNTRISDITRTSIRKKLIEQAQSVSMHSYAPYSHFRIGAALLCADGSVITGTNVENRSFGLTICAERSAFVSAVSLGKSSFRAIAIFAKDSNTPVPPCGACRQVISEFVDPDFVVLFAANDGTFVMKTIRDLLPCDSLHDLKGESLTR